MNHLHKGLPHHMAHRELVKYVRIETSEIGNNQLVFKNPCEDLSCDHAGLRYMIGAFWAIEAQFGHDRFNDKLQKLVGQGAFLAICCTDTRQEKALLH